MRGMLHLILLSALSPFKQSFVAVSHALLACSLLAAGCQVDERRSVETAVSTLNPGYHRLRSNALVRRVRVPTEANLDYAAYSKNVMLVDPEWRAVHPRMKIGLGDLGFDGLVEEAKPILDFTPLTEEEKSRPMAWTPVLEHLLKWNFARATPLANAYGKVTSEKWGDTTDHDVPLQEFGSVYIHSRGNVREVWVELEFRPWIGSSLEGIMDRDQDRFPEVIARLNPGIFTAEMVEVVQGDYSAKALMEPEVMDWARNLVSRWGPSYNADFADLREGSAWPYEDAPLAVKKEMAGTWVANPVFILRGRPFQDTLFNVFEVEGMGPIKSAEARRKEGMPVERGLDKGLSRRLEAIMARMDGEAARLGGGSWEAWNRKLGPFREDIRQFGTREARTAKGLMGRDGHLLLRRDLEYLAAPDWGSPASRGNPLSFITSLKDRLAAQGIDFLFVPIPTKLDVYPEAVFVESGTPADGGGLPALPGGIAQPQLRKALRDLAEARVETVDLLEPFLRIKAASDSGKRLLYQKQDSHWTTTGLESAAQVLAERIRQFGWYDSTYRDKRDYVFRDSVFESLGDIQARPVSGSPEAEGVVDAASGRDIAGPETLLGRQVADREGRLYEDSPSASILVIGDGYTGVFQSVGCRHAGVTAHLAARLGGPVDLITGWGGGPEAPQKLAKRGASGVEAKRLVIWMMSARDLFAYPGEWPVPGDWAAR